MTPTPVIELRQASKRFVRPSGPPVDALSAVSLTVPAGQLLAVVGRSGSGKSTLLNLLVGLDRPTAGAVVVGGHDLGGMGEDALAVWRGRHVGVVFQFFQLMPTLTALENVLLAMDFVGRVPRSERRAKGLRLLQQVGLADHANRLPSALSGGEQQRVAVARALANDPALVVADEPTGSLDSRTAEAVMGLFRTLVGGGLTLVLVTHDDGLARGADRIVRLADGVVTEDSAGGQP